MPATQHEANRHQTTSSVTERRQRAIPNAHQYEPPARSNATTGSSQGQAAPQSDSVGFSDASRVATFFILRNKRTILLALQNLYESRHSMNEAMEQLATGKKVNSAADDAAGLAIADRMSTRINGLRQARVNADDGISLAQTAGDALTQINSNLQRIRQLTVKASNGTISKPGLAAIQAEIDALMADIDRISDESRFNGVDLFKKDKSIEIQVGAGDGEVVSIELAKMNTEALKLAGFNVSGYDCSLEPVMDATFDSVRLDRSGAASKSVATHITWAVGNSVLTTDKLALVHDIDGDYYARRNAASAADVYAVRNIEGIVGTNGAHARIVATVDASYAESQKTAQPLATLDSALHDVTVLRSSLGATQNRLDAIVAQIATTVLGLTSARSRIVDTNYAIAVSKFSQAKITQNANIAVLAQANQTSRGVSALLS